MPSEAADPVAGPGHVVIDVSVAPALFLETHAAIEAREVIGKTLLLI